MISVQSSCRGGSMLRAGSAIALLCCLTPPGPAPHALSRGPTSSFSVSGGTAAAPDWIAWPSVAGIAQPITLTFCNPTSMPIALPGPAPWWIEDGAGRMVREPSRAMGDEEIVSPGTARAWSWDQSQDSGLPAGPGVYDAKIRWRYTVAAEWEIAETTARILEKDGRQPPPEPVPTTGLRGRRRSCYRIP